MSGSGFYSQNQGSDCCCCSCWRRDVTTEIKGRMLRGGWIVPRRTMCIVFWVGILLLFAGIILLVTSKHRGIIFQSWGGVSVGLGFCLLLICFILCVHAYWVISHGDRDRSRANTPQLPQTRSAEFLKQRYELPPKFTTTTASPKLSTAPNGRLKNIQIESVVELQTGRNKTLYTAEQAGINRVPDHTNSSNQSSHKDLENSHSSKAIERHRLLENSGTGSFGYFRTVPSTIDEEDEEASTNSVAPANTNLSSLLPSYNTVPTSYSSTNVPVSLAGKSGRSRSPVRSIPLTNPPPLPTPPNNPQLSSTTSRLPGSEPQRLPSGTLPSPIKSSTQAGRTQYEDNSTLGHKPSIHNGGHSNFMSKAVPSNDPLRVNKALSQDRHHINPSQYPSGCNEPFTRLDCDDIDTDFVQDFRVAIKDAVGRDTINRSESNYGSADRNQRRGPDRQVVYATVEKRDGAKPVSIEMHDVSQIRAASHPRHQYGQSSSRQPMSGTYRCDTQTRILDSNFTGAGGDESDLSPSMTLDWTNSDDSNPLSSTSDEGSHQRHQHNPRVYKTSPESVIECSVPGVARIVKTPGGSGGSSLTTSPTGKSTLPRQQLLTLTQLDDEPSSRKTPQRAAPALRAHTAALSDEEGRTMEKRGAVLQPSGLMMRPFVDGTVTVTPLAGNDENYRTYMQGRCAGGARTKQTVDVPPSGERTKQTPDDLDELTSNMTECSIDSKVTIYDNVNYMNL